jgi:fructose-1,6-bisphosphatase/inositol monophosphatase family enzyme
VDHDRILALFDTLTAETVQRLGQLAHWGLSGQRATQYHHDLVADEVVLKGLHEAGLGILSEESGLEPPPEGTDVTVVVDPVDGSTNASRGLPWYAISLCAVDRDGPAVALVANLANGDRYRAIRGRGARWDRLPVVVGPRGPEGEPRSSIPAAGSPVGGGFDEAMAIAPSGCGSLDEAMVSFSGLPPKHGGWSQFRTLGAAALDLCAVADGRLDAYVDVNGAHGVWDYLGSMLVCHEAGAVVEETAGQELVVLDPEARRGPVAASTPELQAELHAMIDSWA